jgi:hypothetical protein
VNVIELLARASTEVPELAALRWDVDGDRAWARLPEPGKAACLVTALAAAGWKRQD